MQFFAGFMALLFAVLISAVAGYFSIIGLATLFSATFWAVVVMGVVLEGGKLVAAAWLHANWRNKAVGWLHKTYLTLAVFALMVITAVGIYGFLAKGYLEQEAPLATVNIQIEQREAQITQLRGDLDRLTNRQRQLDAAVDALIAQNRVTQANNMRNQQRTERAEIIRETDAKNREISRLAAEIVPLRTQTSEVQAKLGPIRYVADLFGWQDLDAAVRLVILVLMFAFDPLAVVLVISGTISIGQWIEARRLARGETPKARDDNPAVVYWEVEKREAEFQRELAKARSESRDTFKEWLREPTPGLPETFEVGEPVEPVNPPPGDPKSVGMTFSVAMPPTPPPQAVTFTVPDVPSPPPTKEELLAMLEQRPEVVQELIDAARQADGNTDDESRRWLGKV